MKFATKSVRQYTPHPRHVTTLLSEIKKSIFCRYLADMGVNTNILILSVFKIWSLSPYRLQVKFSMTLFFYLFTIVINLWHQKFVRADVIAVFVNKQDGIQRRGQDFDSLYLKR